MKKAIIITLISSVATLVFRWIFVSIKESKEPDTEYIISGRDTISVTCFGGYTVDLSKAKNAHSYRNKEKDSSFTEFDDKGRWVDSVKMNDSVFVFYWNVNKQ